MLDDDKIPPKVNDQYGLTARFPGGIMSFRYFYSATGDPLDNRCIIAVTPCEKQPIRRWQDWDTIRDTGWEHWLEVLCLFRKEGA
jgi:hypothetical protein